MATDAKVQAGATANADEHQKLKRLGKYVIQRPLGAGGMGTVFLAVDSELRRTVALKVLPRERAKNPKLVKRFKAEGQAAAKLEDDNIVKVYEAGEIDGFLYIALEYVEGIDVYDLIQKHKFIPVKRSIDIVRQVAQALQHAHEKGIVHRDIKPSNLMIRRDGLIKLADLGLARAIDETADASITQAGMTVGTVDYMSPEQARDSKLADIRSDIYSLGCTWYHMLTGQPPFPEGSITGKMAAHATQPPPNPRSINEQVPEAVVAVIHRMMAKDPQDRYQTPQDLLEDLKQAMLGRQEVHADVLAGLAEDDWEQPDPPEQVQQSSPGSAAGTAAETTPERDTRKPAERIPEQDTRTRADRPAERDASSPRTPETPRPGKAKSKRLREDQNGKPPRQGARRSVPPKQSPKGVRRELPPRSEDPKKVANPEKLGMSQKPLDLDRVKMVIIIFVGVCVVGGVGWAFSRMHSAHDIGSEGSLNPYQPDVTQSPTQGTTNTSPVDSVDRPIPPVEPKLDEHDSSVQTTRVNEYQNVELFAGATRPADVPAWLEKARAGLTEDLTRLIVSADKSVSADYPTIAAALKALPAAGGIVELVGRGPFPVAPRELTDVNRLVITARSGSRPVVVMVGEESGPADAWLTFRGQTLELSGVHLVAAGSDLAENAPLIHVASGTLLMRDSTVTATAPSPRPVTAVQLGDHNSSGANCLIENSFLRGSAFAAVRIASTAANVISGNSLLVSDASPAIVIVPDEVPARADDDAKASVSASLYSTAVCSRNSAFAIVTENPDRMSSIELLGRRTVFAAESPEAVWMRIENWPENESGSLSGVRAAGLSWVGDDCSLLGWSRFVQYQPPGRNEPLVYQDPDGWRQFWNAAADDSRCFVSGNPAPELVPGDRVTPQMAASRIESFLVEADADRTAFGLDAQALPTLPENLIDRIRAETARPRLKSPYVVNGREVEFNLAESLKLNDFLNSSDCPDGAVVKLTGSGSQIRPIELKNKSVRLVFPAGDAAVSIHPVRTTAGERPPALIRVENGSIDLVNAQLGIPSLERAAYPLRILQVVDGSFTLEGCILKGQIRDGAQDVPVIEWIRGNDASLQTACIRNSLVAGKFQAVSADLSNGVLECDNSLFVSLGDAFDLFQQGTAAPGYASLTNCTLAAGRSAFLVNSTAHPDSGSVPINCFVERCVFATPPDATSGGPIVLTCPSTASTDGSLVWWGTDNGFDPQVRRYHAPLEAPGGDRQEIQDDWVRFWGGDHIWRPLSGPKEVLLAHGLPEPDRADPADFALAESCAARTWGPGGEPIGAWVDEIGPGKQDGQETSESPAPPGTRRATRTDPGF